MNETVVVTSTRTFACEVISMTQSSLADSLYNSHNLHALSQGIVEPHRVLPFSITSVSTIIRFIQIQESFRLNPHKLISCDIIIKV